MIDDKKIEEAARYYCNNRYPASQDAPFIAEGFRHGAKWMREEFLKDLWHPASEKPVMSKYGMIIVELNDIITCKYSLWRSTTTYENLCNNKGYIHRWLYLDDLIPKLKEGDEQ